MKQWLDHIVQLKEILQNLKHEIAPYWDTVSRKEKQAQLQSIEKTITNMQKSNTSVPDELRELKFKLLKELDLFKEADATKVELQELFAPYQHKSRRKKEKEPKKLNKQAKKDQKSESRITLKYLIDAQLLTVPLNLSKKYKGKIYHAIITQQGHIELQINGSKQIFDSPSAAAVAASNKSQNGWTWWNIEGQPKDRTLDYYRQKIKDHEAQR